MLHLAFNIVFLLFAMQLLVSVTVVWFNPYLVVFFPLVLSMIALQYHWFMPFIWL